MDSPKSNVICYVCHERGHIATKCPKRWPKKKKKKEDAASSSSNNSGSGNKSSSGGNSSKQVNLCSKVTRGMLQINNLQLPFIFDSGSECSLIRQSHCDFLKGEKFHEQVVLKGCKA